MYKLIQVLVLGALLGSMAFAGGGGGRGGNDEEPCEWVKGETLVICRAGDDTINLSYHTLQQNKYSRETCNEPRQTSLWGEFAIRSSEKMRGTIYAYATYFQISSPGHAPYLNYATLQRPNNSSQFVVKHFYFETPYLKNAVIQATYAVSRGWDRTAPPKYEVVEVFERRYECESAR